MQWGLSVTVVFGDFVTLCRRYHGVSQARIVTLVTILSCQKVMDMTPLPADDDRKAATPTSPLSPTASVRQVVATSTYRRAAPLSMAPPEFALPTGPERLTRAINIVLAGTALILLLPLMILVAIAVKLTSRGPILYSQIRVGVDRRAFVDERRFRAERRGGANHPRHLDRSARLDQRATLDRRSRRALAMRGRRTEDVGGHVYRIYKFRSMRVDAERHS